MITEVDDQRLPHVWRFGRPTNTLTSLPWTSPNKMTPSAARDSGQTVNNRHKNEAMQRYPCMQRGVFWAAEAELFGRFAH